MEEEVSPKKLPDSVVIVGVNMLVLIAYTVFSKVSEGGIFLDAILIAAQFFICIITAIAQRRWIWVLSAFVVLLIGFLLVLNGWDHNIKMI